MAKHPPQYDAPIIHVHRVGRVEFDDIAEVHKSGDSEWSTRRVRVYDVDRQVALQVCLFAEDEGSHKKTLPEFWDNSHDKT